MYVIYTAAEGNGSDEGSNCKGLIKIPVPTENIKDIKVSLFLMGIEIYWIEEDHKILFESDRFLEIKQRRMEKRAGK